MDKPSPKRFTLEELEIAVSDATMSGRAYNQGGEKESPVDFHRNALQHAINAVIYHRAHRPPSDSRHD